MISKEKGKYSKGVKSLTSLFVYTNFQMFNHNTRNRLILKQDFLYILVPECIMGFNEIKIMIYHFKSLIFKEKAKTKK